MCDEPTDGRVDRSIREIVLVRSRWGAISFVGHLGLLVSHPPPQPTGIDADKDNQGYNSNGTESAEDDDRYEPCPKTSAHLENRRSGHGWSSKSLPGTREWQP